MASDLLEEYLFFYINLLYNHKKEKRKETIIHGIEIIIIKANR